MSNDLSECLDQLSPLMESAVKLIQSMGLNPSEHIALSFLTCADFSIRAALSIPTRDEALTEEQRECIMELLDRKRRDADEIMQAAAQKFMFGNKVQ